MKKFLILILCLCLPLAFAGCNNKTNKNTDNIIVYPDDESAKTLGGYRQEENSSITPSGSTYYVGNISSKKFHISTCNSATKMKEENRKVTTERQALIDEGYTPCAVCKP